MNRKVLGVMIFVFGLVLTSACSKNLMPPESARLGGEITASEMTGSSSAGDSTGGSAGRGFNIDTDEGDSRFFREENVGESASSGNFTTGGLSGSGDGFSGSGGRDFGSGSGIPGMGSSGSFEAEPFSGGSGGPGGLASSDGSGGSGGFGGGSGNEEARLGNFKPTSELNDIHFKFDRYDLDDQSRSILRENVDYLKANPTAKIEIQGHCDERGTNNYNIALGERRAQSTKMYMVSQGVSSRRIQTISYGEEKPFCFDSNDMCWSKNRRAHFRIDK